MFCPNCGTAEQKENTYCRKCGEFLTLGNLKNILSFGGNTPEEQINTNLIFNVLTAVVSIALAILLYATHYGKENVSFSIYLAAGILLAMGFWQISSFIIGRKLKRNFKKRKESDKFEKQKEKILYSAGMQEFLPEADLKNLVPTTVTEKTTKNLSEKINRKSP
jgi:methionyl-tRNA synthetase